MPSLAVGAIHHGMAGGEGLPVLLLAGAEDTGAHAHRTDAVQGGQDRAANEIAAVGHAPHRLDKRIIDFE